MNYNYTDAIKNRYDFIILYDVENGNPNGDPDSGNMPRIDPETGYGIVTDVCIKRKIRNRIELLYGRKSGFDIYIRQDAILNRQDKTGLDAVSGFNEKDKRSLGFRAEMCRHYFDIRAFGAVMTSAVKDIHLHNSSGQVRGPVQLAFGQSVEPVQTRDITITRVAVASEKDAMHKNVEMGRKTIIPYGLYRQEGYISANLARTVTGFSEEDLDVFWEAVIHMFDDDRSAARGKMTLRELIAFKHDSPLGSAPAHKLFQRLSVSRSEDVSVPRSYSDYNVYLNDQNLPRGVSILPLYRDKEG